jgi:integrase
MRQQTTLAPDDGEPVGGFGVKGGALTEKTKRARRERGIKQLSEGRWRYSWKFQGRYHRMTAPTHAIAVASLGKIRAQIAEGRYLEKEVSQQTRFEDAVDKFLKWSATNTAPGTNFRDKIMAGYWLTFGGFKGKSLAGITAADAEDYRTDRLTVRRAWESGGRTFYRRLPGKRTCDYELSRLRRLFSLCIKWKLTKENPAKGVDFFKPESRRDRFLTRDEEATITNACPPDIRPAVLFAANTGLRQMELLTLTWGQVDLPRKTITLTGDKTKSGKTRRVPLNALALEALRSLPRGIDPKAPVFLTLTRDGRDALVRRYNRALIATGINRDASPTQRVSWHTLRHTFASRLVQAGVNLLTVKELLGHSSLVMVMRYAHLADDNLKAAVDILAADPKLHESCTATGEGPEGSAP